MKNNLECPAGFAGIYTLSLRSVIGWTYFSAILRCLILDNKLILNGWPPYPPREFKSGTVWKLKKNCGIGVS